MSRLPRISASLAAGVFLMLMICMAFGPAVQNGFIDYDDNLYVVQNSHVRRGLTLHGLEWAFTTTTAANWHPLTWLSHMADVQLFKMRPGGHHLTNLLLHTANSLLLFLAIRLMTGWIWKSFLVAALFAVHPLHVQSVAWVAERKDVLSAFFWMLTMLLYTLYALKPGKARYAWALLAFLLGLLAKPMLVSLPLVLILLDYWPLGRMPGGESKTADRARIASLRQLLREKMPFFLLAGIWSVATYSIQRQSGTVVPVEILPLQARLANASASYMTYLIKTFAPADLSFLYPYRPIALWKAAASTAALAAITLSTARFRRRFPYLMVGWLWFLVTLLPVIGIVQVGHQAMADRYTYVTITGVFIAAVWGSSRAASRLKIRPSLLFTAAAVLLFTLAARSRMETYYWRSSEILAERALHLDGGNWDAYNILGVALAGKGRQAEAVAAYEKSLMENPGSPELRYNLADSLAKLGRSEEAMYQYRQAIALNPKEVNARIGLGALFRDQGKPAEAVQWYREAVAIEPENIVAREHLANILDLLGDPAGAERAYGEALRLDPENPETHFGHGLFLARRGNTEAALAEFRETVSLNPDHAEALYNLGGIMELRGETAAAADYYLQAIDKAPDLAGAHNNLGIILAREGRMEEAARHFRLALRANPDLLEARRNLEKLEARTPP